MCASNELVVVLLLNPIRLSDQSSLAFKLFPDAFSYSIIITSTSSFRLLRLVTVLTLVLSFHLLYSIDRDVFYIVPINSCNQAYSPLIYSILSHYIFYFLITIHSFSYFLFFSTSISSFLLFLFFTKLSALHFDRDFFFVLVLFTSFKASFEMSKFDNSVLQQKQDRMARFQAENQYFQSQ